MLEGRGLGCSHGTRSARYARRLSPKHASAIAGQRRRTRESWRQRQGRRLWESVKAEQAYISYASVLARGGRRTRGGRDCAVRMRLCGSARWRRCSPSSSRRAAAPSGPSSARGRIPVGEDCLWDNADAGQDGIPRPRGRSLHVLLGATRRRSDERIEACIRTPTPRSSTAGSTRSTAPARSRCCSSGEFGPTLRRPGDVVDGTPTPA